MSLPEPDPSADDRRSPATRRAGYFAGPSADHSTESQLRDLEARYRSVIDHLPAVIYVDGVDDGASMVDVSPGIYDLLGIEPQE